MFIMAMLIGHFMLGAVTFMRFCRLLMSLPGDFWLGMMPVMFMIHNSQRSF
jgi:hypothetical protein